MQERKIKITYEAIYDIVEAEEHILYRFGSERAKQYRKDIYAELKTLSTDATIYAASGFKYRGYTIFKKPFSPAVGGEVNRAINWANKGNTKRAENFCKKAKELLQLSIEDPKNRGRIGELFNCICELEDRFLGDNYYGTTDEMLRKYYDAFI